MNTRVATAVDSKTRRSARAVAVLAIGPVAILAGIVWAVLQPYRITLLDPHGQGFWWLFSQPPLYVVLVGLFFHLAIAPGLVSDLEETE